MLRHYVIERSNSGADPLPAEAMSGVAANARTALEALGPDARWLQSFVTHDRTYCIYLARDDGAHSAR